MTSGANGWRESVRRAGGLTRGARAYGKGRILTRRKRGEPRRATEQYIIVIDPMRVGLSCPCRAVCHDRGSGTGQRTRSYGGSTMRAHSLVGTGIPIEAFRATAPVVDAAVVSVVRCGSWRQALPKGSKQFQPQMHANARRCTVRLHGPRDPYTLRNMPIADRSRLSICMHLRATAVEIRFSILTRNYPCNPWGRVSRGVSTRCRELCITSEFSPPWPSVALRTSSVLKSGLLAETRAPVAMPSNRGAPA